MSMSNYLTQVPQVGHDLFPAYVVCTGLKLEDRGDEREERKNACSTTGRIENQGCGNIDEWLATLVTVLGLVCEGLRRDVVAARSKMIAQVRNGKDAQAWGCPPSSMQAAEARKN